MLIQPSQLGSALERRATIAVASTAAAQAIGAASPNITLLTS